MFPIYTHSRIALHLVEASYITLYFSLLPSYLLFSVCFIVLKFLSSTLTKRSDRNIYIYIYMSFLVLFIIFFHIVVVVELFC